MEIWKPIKNYEGFYEVSNLGRVKSLTRYVNHSRGGKQILKGRILKPRIPKKIKYHSVALNKNANAKSFYIHYLVASTFIKCDENKNLVIDHIDNDKSNNKVSNLRYCTQRENLNNRSLISATGYVGVSKNPPNYKNRYRARIRINNKM